MCGPHGPGGWSPDPWPLNFKSKLLTSCGTGILFSNWDDPVEGQFENEIEGRSVEGNLKMKLGWTPWDPVKVRCGAGDSTRHEPHATSHLGPTPTGGRSPPEP